MVKSRRARPIVDKWEKLHQELAPSEEVPDWDEYFYVIALAVSLRSKDASRKVGAVVVSEDKVILATGFNGFPRGVRELDERREEKSEKLAWTAHAEANAVFNAARVGAALRGSTIYSTTFPCCSCARAIVQAGIKTVISYGEHWKNDPDGPDKAFHIFDEGKIRIVAPRVLHPQQSDAASDLKPLRKTTPRREQDDSGNASGTA